MKRYTRIEIPEYKLIHVINFTCLKPYVLQIIRVWNHTRMKSYTLQIIHFTNHTRMKWRHLIGRSATHPCPANHMRMKSYTLQIIRVTNHTRMKWRHLIEQSETHPCPVLLSPRVASRRGRSSVAKRVFYNMVCSALFLQRAFYNIMHSRKPSFVITPPFLVNTVNRYFMIYAAMKYATFYWNSFIWLPLI